MYKKIILFVVLSLALLGCSKGASDEEIKIQKYHSYYNEIINNEIFLTTSSFFDTEIVMTKLSDGQYKYEIIIDNPKVAMFNISALVVEVGVSVNIDEQMLPEFGIFNNLSKNMIPNQVNLDNNYVKGIVLGGITTNEFPSIRLYVNWQNYGNLETYKEFIEFEIVAITDNE